MAEITITIDNKIVTCEEGEYLLNVARANGIYIPAICYLNRCSPTLACRLCLVETDGKQAYACNAKAKAGMNVVTESEEILKERRAIMEVYDVNHPLECGVCDKSGECELQNNTLEQGIDRQGYCIPDTHRKVHQWNFIKYDASLCIVCERCVTACNDGIGDNALKTVPRGGIEIDKGFKESMPKNAYAIWNKMNKSLIGPSSGIGSLDCTYCGECIAVCPVGALTSPSFTYTSNSWELTKIPSTCGHCSAGCHLQYEVKHSSIENTSEKVYRITNEWHFQSLCGAGRFAFDYALKTVKNNARFDAACFAMEKADTLIFDSMITNEEALILQKLREKKGYRLINPEALALQKFIRAYGGLWKGTLSDVRASNFIVSVGSALVTDNPEARYAMNNGIKMNKGGGIYFHPIEDKVIAGMGKNILSLRNNIGSEEFILGLLVDMFVPKERLSEELVRYLASFHSLKKTTITEKVKEKVAEKITKEDGSEEIITKEIEKSLQKEIDVDENALFSVIGLSPDVKVMIDKLLEKKDTFSLLLGEDCLTHSRSENIAKLASLLEHEANFHVVVLPPKANTLGVALICELSEAAGEYSVGYNVKGNFTLSALGEEVEQSLAMPPFIQQEGTITTLNCDVVPLNAALGYEGYELNDLANVLGVKAANTIDYTQNLPLSCGFSTYNFDQLPNHFDNNGTVKRGYKLSTIQGRRSLPIVPFAPISHLEGQIGYCANSVLSFNAFTEKALGLKAKKGVGMSKTMFEAMGLKEGECIILDDKHEEVYIADNILGNIVYVPQFKEYGYRFKTIFLRKGEQ